MDPNETLDRLREALSIARSQIEGGAQPEHYGDYVHALEVVAECAEALDDWITKGGFLPYAWLPVKAYRQAPDEKRDILGRLSEKYGLVDESEIEDVDDDRPTPKLDKLMRSPKVHDLGSPGWSSADLD